MRVNAWIMTLYPSYTKAPLLEGAPLTQIAFMDIPFNEFEQLPYATHQPPSSDPGWG